MSQPQVLAPKILTINRDVNNNISSQKAFWKLQHHHVITKICYNQSTTNLNIPFLASFL